MYKIKIDDSYLLVKSRKHGKYQPVGGNFKRNKYSTGFLEKIELCEDEYFTDGKMDYSKMGISFLTMPDNKYWSLGNHIGNAWKDGMNYLK